MGSTSTRANAGDAAAQFNLALMYDFGRGVPQDDVKGAAWYRQAAEQGYAKAQYNLGFMYATGRSGGSSLIATVRLRRGSFAC